MGYAMTHSTISISDVQYVAVLAKIAVSDDEAAKLCTELETILSYVRQLDELNTSGVEPTYQVTGLTNIDREDELIDYGVTPEALLQNAPSTQDKQIKVPKVL